MRQFKIQRLSGAILRDENQQVKCIESNLYVYMVKGRQTLISVMKLL